MARRDEKGERRRQPPDAFETLSNYQRRRFPNGTHQKADVPHSPGFAMPAAFVEAETFADLLEELGGISPSRVRLRPTPGRATEKDVIRLEAQENRLFELVDGVLVEKAMGAKESLLALHVGFEVKRYLQSNDLGVALGADGMIRLRPRLVRIPDVSFISWDQIPGGEFPSKPIPDLYPNLAVEVLSDSNTP